MLTNKGKYGLKAMVHLAGAEPGKPVLVTDIAEANNVPKKFLDTILGELRNAGLVRSKKGKGGGYALAHSPDEIMVGQIVRVLDGPLAPIRCASHNYYDRCEDCASEKDCTVHLMMYEVRNAIAHVLDSRTLAEMRALSPANAKRSLNVVAKHEPAKRLVAKAPPKKLAPAAARSTKTSPAAKKPGPTKTAAKSRRAAPV